MFEIPFILDYTKISGIYEKTICDAGEQVSSLELTPI